MMEEIPKIRFEGFTKVWEERKLGEVTDVKTGPFGSVLHAEDYVSDGIPIITTEHFKSGRLPETKAGLPQVSDEDYSRLSGYTLETDDIVFSRVGSVDINALVTSSQNQWLFSGRVLRVRPCQGVDSMFLHTLLETGGIRNDIISRAVGQTMPSINTEILKDTLLCLPQDIEEQKAIGEYFQKLEDLIMLHQSKCDETKELKKYMLQKMFPKNDEKIPEIRFKGFTGGWEQRKLGEVFEEYSEKNHLELPVLTIIQGGGTIKREESDRNIVYDKASLASYKLVRKGDFILHLRSFEGGLERATCDGIISPAYHTFHSIDVDSRFYYSFFRSYEFISKKLVPHIYGIRDGKSIDIEGMKSIEIPYPCIQEQKKIGDYIENLDHLITLYQHRCDALQETKKYMLQNMFPQKG